MISISFHREFEALQLGFTPSPPSLLYQDIDEKPSVCVYRGGGAVTFGELSPDGFVFFGMQVSNARIFATSIETEISYDARPYEVLEGRYENTCCNYGKIRSYAAVNTFYWSKKICFESFKHS